MRIGRSVLDGGDGAAGVAFWAIVLAMLPAVLDQTILATALPTIATDLGRIADVSWVVTAYVVAAAAAAPVWGKVGDRLGRKVVLEASLAMFLAASAVCGVAPSLWMLVVARAVQGAAAGGLMSLAQAAVGDLVSPRDRGRYQGYIMAVFAVAAALGPLLGGLLVDHANWRWVFYLNLPVGAVALAVLHLRLPSRGVAGPGRPVAGAGVGGPGRPGEGGGVEAPRTPLDGAGVEAPRTPLDGAGATLLAVMSSALMLACLWGGQRYAWGSAQILGLLAVFGLTGAMLVFRTRRIADPIIPLSLIGNRAVALASVALFLVTATMFSITVFVPVFLQTTTGATPTQAGLLLIPMMVGITVSTNVAGRLIQRTGRYKVFPVVGLVLITAALVSLAVVVEHPSQIATGIALAVFGLGFGMVGQVLIIAVQNTVEGRELGLAMALTGFFRGLGGAVGAAALGAVFASRVGHAGSGTLALAHAGRADLISGVHLVFLVTAPIALAALAAVMALEEVPLRGPSHPGRGAGTGAPASGRPAAAGAAR